MEEKKGVADKKTAVQKVEEFCEREGIIWTAKVVAEEETSSGGLIVKSRVVIDYKSNVEESSSPLKQEER